MSEEMAMIAGPSSNEQGEASSSKYKGVRKRKWGKWVSEIRLPNSRERIWLGSYDSAEKAARAFDAAQFCLRGRNARFNFPDDPPNIAGGRDLSPSEIQVAAAQFANSSATEPPRSPGPGRASCLVPRTESPSASEGTVVGMEHDFGMYTDVPFFDPIRNGGGSGYYGSDYGIFPGFDDLNDDYFGSNMVINGNNYGEENYDGVLVPDYRLWNF